VNPLSSLVSWCFFWRSAYYDLYSKIHPGQVCPPERLSVTVLLRPRYHLMLRQLLQMQGGNSSGLGKKLAGSLGWNLPCSVSSSLEPPQLPRPLLGQLTALCVWQPRVRVSWAPEAWRGGPAVERWSGWRRQRHRERQDRAAHPRPGFLAGGGWDRGGWGSKGRSGICLFSLHLP